MRQEREFVFPRECTRGVFHVHAHGTSLFDDEPVPSCGFLELPHESFGRGSRSGTVVPRGVKCSLSHACRMGVSCDNRYSAGELHDVDDTRNFPRRVFVIRDKRGILERWSDHHGEQHPWEAHVHSKHGLAGRLIVRVESL